MSLPAAQGLSVLYVLMDDWMGRQQMLAALGIDDLDLIETALAQTSRSAQVARFMAAAGGD